MKSELDKLNDQEVELKSIVESIKGSIEDIQNKIIELKIPEKYEEIYKAYYNLYNLTGDIESLKRAIFIQWFAVSEPLAFTGINSINGEIQKETLIILNNLIINFLIDDEFKVMIKHYYVISDWYFDSYLDFSKSVKTLSGFDNKFIISTDDRGAMGSYWKLMSGCLA